MSPRLSLVAAVASGLLTAAVSAQSDEADARVWAVAAFVNHGEKTPSFGTFDEMLTPGGAQQIYRQGSAFRARYLNDTGGFSDDELDNIGVAPIHGINTDAIDHNQVSALATGDEWVSAGALAFFQGLYPPTTSSYNSFGGGDAMSRNLAENGTETIEYPLDGYQYPNLQTLSMLDSDSPSLQGTIGCTAWVNEVNVPLKKRQDIEELYSSNADFYRGLFSTKPLVGTVTPDAANFFNAHELYEYVSYMYAHNETVFEGLDDANHTLAKLEDNALALARAMNIAPVSSSGKSSDTATELYPIAGRTLAMKIADQLQRNLDWDGQRDKLTVMFGSFEPIMAYLSVAGILTRVNTESGTFAQFPRPGATMVLELIGDEPADSESDTAPDPADLRVRFYYLAGADPGDYFEPFPLFNSGLGGSTVPYATFRRIMTDSGITSERWCEVCESTTAPWCATAYTPGARPGSSSGSTSTSHRLHPALAGLIGAIVMAAVLAVVALALFALGGFRVRRASSEDGAASSPGGGGGGFKGPEKKQPDADVAVSPVGQKHERMGSWEMRDGAGGGGESAAPYARSTAGGETDHEDAASVFGATVVSPREGV